MSKVVLACLALLLVGACSSDDAAIQPDAGIPDSQAPGPSCSDGIKNGDETDVDCGGGCGSTCAIDAACLESDDCAAGALCDVAPSPTDSSLRACRPHVETCVGNPCAADAYCRPHTIDDNGAILVCALRAPIGATCDKTGGTGDRAVNPCVTGAVCATDPADPFHERCIAAVPEGAACTSQNCDEGLACISGMCRPLKAEAATCLNTDECRADLHCDQFRGKCEPRAGAEGACYDAQDECATGLECAFAAGLACTSWFQCGSQMECCATDTGSVCQPAGTTEACEPPSGTCKDMYN